MNLKNTNIKKIKGDASFRTFFRKRNNNKSSIIVHAKKEKKQNLLIYDCINRLLINNKITAPRLYKENYKKNFIEIEDFGDKTLFELLKVKKKNQIKFFKKSILLLKKIQKIKEKNSKDFKNKDYRIPLYSKKELFEESKLFCEWYVPKVIKKNKVFMLNKKIKKQIKILLSKIKLKNEFFVHKDFHLSNLMQYKNNIAIIDNQDAKIGNRAYDLASLIDDVRFKTSTKLKIKLLKYYMDINQNNINKVFFENDFEILSILRNLKIIGIFTRLSIRDKKKQYLKLIPYAWKLIEFRLNNQPFFKGLKDIFEENFPKKVRIKK